MQERKDARTCLLSFITYSKPDYRVAPFHRQIAERLEAVERGELNRLAIFMPPRHGKSEIASRRFPAWFMGRNPGRQLICASYGSDLATDFGREVRNIVASAEFAAVFPDVQLSPDSQAANRWHTGQGGIYVATGIGGALTGRGAHVALVDDPVKDQQDAESEIVRGRTWDWYVSVLRTRLMPRSAVVLIQTRWHEDDLAGRILNSSEGSDWEVISLPAITHGEALWPEAYPLAELESIRALDARKFSALYQQNPTPEDGTFFRREWFKWYDIAPAGNAYTTADFAVTDGGGDFTEIGTHRVDSNDDLYLCVDSWSGQTSSDRWIEELCAQFAKHKPMCFFGESGPIKRAIEPFLTKRMRERRAFCRLEWLPSIHDKATRARALQARAAMGKVYLPRNERGERLCSQMLQFPAGLHDDAVDMASLLGQAIDQAHPGVAPLTNVVRKKIDRWDIAFGNEYEDVDSWKTA